MFRKCATRAAVMIVMGLLAPGVILFGCSSTSRNIAGDWGGAYDVTANVVKIDMRLSQDGNKLSGEYSAFEPATMYGFSGATEGRISGNEVFLTFKVDGGTKAKKRLSDLEFKGVVKVEEGQEVISGWTTSKYESSKKVMETILTKGSAAGE